MPARSTSATETTATTSKGEGRTVVTLSPSVATAVRRMGAMMGDVGPTEVVRRGLILLDVLLGLDEDQEELVVRNKETQQIERLRFAWDL